MALQDILESLVKYAKSFLDLICRDSDRRCDPEYTSHTGDIDYIATQIMAHNPIRYYMPNFETGRLGLRIRDDLISLKRPRPLTSPMHQYFFFSVFPKPARSCAPLP